MATFMITCDHNPEDCEAMSKELELLGAPDFIKGRDFYCSCPFGHHAGWIKVEGESKESLLAGLPPIFRSHANAYQIETVVF